MAEGILKFTLPEEEPEFKLAQEGVKWMSLVHEMDNEWRTSAKHGEDTPIAPSKLREKLYELMSENGLSFDN